MSSTWEDIVAVALLGTQQQQVPRLAGDDPVGRLLEKLESVGGKSKESVLLGAAGTVAVHNAAGKAPVPGIVTKVEPPAADLLPVCKPIGRTNFKLLLEEYKTTVLPLWLLAMAKSGHRLPESTIPLLLDLAAFNNALRPLIGPVIGHRGRWLAAQNPDWEFAAGRDVSESSEAELRSVFETGSITERTSAIGRLRGTNPAAARELVESAWKDDSYQNKTAFLERFRIGLSISDELFLEETALNDKRKEVRLAAAQLLSRIPNSKLAQRLEARATSFLRVKGLLKKQLDVSYPDQFDKELLGGGNEKSNAVPSTEERQYWLLQLISMVSPAVWEKHFNMTAQQIVSMDCDVMQKHYVQDGWCAATILHENETWAEAFCFEQLSQANADLMSFLAPAVRERIILKMIERNKGKLSIHGQGYQQPIMTAMMGSTHDWSENFGRQLIPALVEEARDGVSYFGEHLFLQIGRYYPVSLAKEIEGSFKTINPEYVDKFLAALRFKTEVYLAFSK